MSPSLTPLPERLHHIIRYLCRWHPEWGTVEGASQQRKQASHELRRWLQAIHYPYDVIAIPVERLLTPHPRWESFRGHEHCIARYALQCGDTIVDLTARQFDATAPFPTITHTHPAHSRTGFTLHRGDSSHFSSLCLRSYNGGDRLTT